MGSRAGFFFLKAPKFCSWFSWSPLYLVCTGEYPQGESQPCLLMQRFSTSTL